MKILIKDFILNIIQIKKKYVILNVYFLNKRVIMEKIVGIDNIYLKLKQELDLQKDILIYAFNATGKTRLTYFFKSEENEEDEDQKFESLCYNSILEDLFYWDNENKIFNFNKNNIFFKIIEEEGLDNRLINNFKNLIDSKLEPDINCDTGKITFKLATGDNESQDNIKISRGEETLFKWATFYTVLEYAIEILKEKKEDRSINLFDNIKYILVDDPISSIDDYRVYTVSVQIIESINYIHESNFGIKFLITTHHALFYNLLYGKLKNRNKKNDIKSLFYIMSKTDEGVLLNQHTDEFPIAYHLTAMEEINQALINDTIEKKYYNMFRSVLEKFASFLGHQHWSDMFERFERKEELKKIVNMNSHGKYVELESRYLTNEQLEIFKDSFIYFKNKFEIKFKSEEQ